MTAVGRSKKFRFQETQDRDHSLCETAFSIFLHRYTVIILIGCDRKPKKEFVFIFELFLRQLANIVSGPRCLTGSLSKDRKEEVLKCLRLTKL